MGELITQLWYSSSISFAACEARCPDLPPLLLEIGSPVAALWRWFTHKVNEGAEVPLGFPSPPPFSCFRMGSQLSVKAGWSKSVLSLSVLPQLT